MKSFEAIKEAVDGHVQEIARLLGVSQFTVYKWTEPTPFEEGNGVKQSYLDRLELLIRHSLSLGMSFDKATAPIRYLAERFGLITIPLPRHEGNHLELVQQLLKEAEIFGELAAKSSAALDDGTIEKKEANDIERLGWQLIRQTSILITRAKESAQ